jgi:hypothetical protein
MHFCHSSAISSDFPELVPGVMAADGITADVVVGLPNRRRNYSAVRNNTIRRSAVPGLTLDSA